MMPSVSQTIIPHLWPNLKLEIPYRADHSGSTCMGCLVKCAEGIQVDGTIKSDHDEDRTI